MGVVDRAPRKLPNSSSRLIAMAASLAGSAEAVRKLMGCSEEEFRDYRSGRKEVPWSQLDPVVGLIVYEQGKVVRRNRAAIEEARRRSRNRDRSN